jgi:hypothetical protein
MSKYLICFKIMEFKLDDEICYDDVDDYDFLKL